MTETTVTDSSADGILAWKQAASPSGWSLEPC